MHDLKLAQDGSRIGGEDHLREVVDDELVAAVGAEGGLDGLADGAAGIDVADYGAVVSIVAVSMRVKMR